jgi:hypothetical protein
MAPKRTAGMTMTMQPIPPMMDRPMPTLTVLADKALCQYTWKQHDHDDDDHD